MTDHYNPSLFRETSAPKHHFPSDLKFDLRGENNNNGKDQDQDQSKNAGPDTHGTMAPQQSTGPVVQPQPQQPWSSPTSPYSASSRTNNANGAVQIPSTTYTSSYSTTSVQSTTSSTTASTMGGNDANQNPNGGNGGPNYEINPAHGIFAPWLIATVIAIPLIIIGVSIAALIIIIRARRRQREAEAAGMPEMRNLTPVQPRDERAYIRPPSSEPPSSVTERSQSDATASASETPPTQRQSQPVILSTTMDQAYYTGLDTADQISLSDARSHVSVDIYDGDEPPPPYRPRSVPPISRDASVRTSHTTRTSSIARRNQSNDQSTTHLIAGVRRSHDMRSPFEDPEDDDDDASAISDITVRPQRHSQQDRLSVVSDLSYQDEPVQGRSSL